jgi:hypothetical protein
VKRSDVIFIIVVVVLIAGAFLLFEVVKNSSGRVVVIEEGNEEVGTYPLSEDTIVKVQGPLGITTVVIENGEVYVSDSPCPNKVCIAMGKISEKGDTIVCLPNRVYITVR